MLLIHQTAKNENVCGFTQLGPTGRDRLILRRCSTQMLRCLLKRPERRFGICKYFEQCDLGSGAGSNDLSLVVYATWSVTLLLGSYFWRCQRSGFGK